MSRIEDPSFIYSFLRYYVDKTFDWGFRKIEYRGLENIPTDGALIYAPNHTNALMDALSVLVVHHAPTVFVARADIFRKPKVAKLLRFFKIMPIMRIRDGYENLQKNKAIMQEAVSVLESKVPFCILPEGTHRTMHSMLPLLKGIFRIALMANEDLNGKMPIYIVPMGIDYGDFFRYRSTLLLQVGKPINVTKFVEEHRQLEQPELMNALREVLTKEMRKLIFYIPDDQYYNARYELVMIAISFIQKPKYKRNEHLSGELKLKQEIIAKIGEYEKEDVELAKALLESANEFQISRENLKIADEVICKTNFSYWSYIWRMILLIVTSPYFLYCALLTAPITYLTEKLKIKLDDPAFNNSVRYVLVLALFPIIIAILAIIAFSCLKWYIALGLVAIAIPSHIFFHAYLRRARIVRGIGTWLKHKDLQAKHKELAVKLKGILKTEL